MALIRFTKADLREVGVMSEAKHVIDTEGEVRELTAEDLAQFRPAAEVLPSALVAKLKARGRQEASTKERATIPGRAQVGFEPSASEPFSE
jgi:hypothetical protein